MRCEEHPEVESVGLCVSCGKAICEACKTVKDERYLCPECALIEWDGPVPEKKGVPMPGGASLGELKGITTWRHGNPAGIGRISLLIGLIGCSLLFVLGHISFRMASDPTITSLMMSDIEDAELYLLIFLAYFIACFILACVLAQMLSGSKKTIEYKTTCLMAILLPGLAIPVGGFLLFMVPLVRGFIVALPILGLMGLFYSLVDTDLSGIPPPMKHRFWNLKNFKMVYTLVCAASLEFFVANYKVFGTLFLFASFTALGMLFLGETIWVHWRGLKFEWAVLGDRTRTDDEGKGPKGPKRTGRWKVMARQNPVTLYVIVVIPLLLVFAPPLQRFVGHDLEIVKAEVWEGGSSEILVVNRGAFEAKGLIQLWTVTDEGRELVAQTDHIDGFGRWDVDASLAWDDDTILLYFNGKQLDTEDILHHSSCMMIPMTALSLTVCIPYLGLGRPRSGPRGRQRR